jgi:excisionase family DNA binding protein
MADLGAGADEAQALEPLMCIDEVADILRISERGVYRLISSGELVSLKVRGRTLFERDEVRRFIASQRQPVRPTPQEQTA